MRLAIVLSCALLVPATGSPAVAQSASPDTLRSPSEFDSIPDRAQRSRAIFTELGKLFTHPRCMNCHPAGDQPLQGAEHRLHRPPVQRAAADYFGAPCSTCHTDRNFTVYATASFKSIPGHPRWGLAPREMAWEGKTLPEICAQLEDRARNGGRDLTALQEHVAKDDLVAWGWHPGEGREPAPGSQELAGRLMQAWIDSGAECP